MGTVKSMLRASRVGWILPIAAACLCQGCGTGEYGKRMDKTLTGLRTSSPFNVLYGPSDLKGTPATIRVPQSLGSPAEPKTVEPGGENGADPAQPPLVKLYGLKSRWQMLTNDSDGGQVPYYCYLAAAPVDKGGKSMERRLAEDVNVGFPQTSPAWQDVQCKTPDGGTIKLKRMTVSGTQPFACVNKEGTLVTKNLPSSFDVFLYATDTLEVVIAWSVPTSIPDQAKLDELKLLTAGTVTVP
jgi:hypothetical protein